MKLEERTFGTPCISMTSTFQCEYCQCFTFKRCDKFNNGRHLGFYQELEIRLKPREMVIFCEVNENNT